MPGNATFARAARDAFRADFPGKNTDPIQDRHRCERLAGRDHPAMSHSRSILRAQAGDRLSSVRTTPAKPSTTARSSRCWARTARLRTWCAGKRTATSAALSRHRRLRAALARRFALREPPAWVISTRASARGRRGRHRGTVSPLRTIAYQRVRPTPARRAPGGRPRAAGRRYELGGITERANAESIKDTLAWVAGTRGGAYAVRITSPAATHCWSGGPSAGRPRARHHLPGCPSRRAVRARHPGHTERGRGEGAFVVPEGAVYPLPADGWSPYLRLASEHEMERDFPDFEVGALPPSARSCPLRRLSTSASRLDRTRHRGTRNDVNP